MLRYLKAVQLMKQIIDENQLTVMCTIARYACAYEAVAKPDWWNKSKRYCRARMLLRTIFLTAVKLQRGTYR
jgi:predicted dehydrogenase